MTRLVVWFDDGTIHNVYYPGRYEILSEDESQFEVVYQACQKLMNHIPDLPSFPVRFAVDRDGELTNYSH